MQLPFTDEQFHGVFRAYNATVWPAQVLLVALALAAIVLVFAPRPWSSAGVSAILAFLWAWLGLAYQFAFFTSIYPLAYLFCVVSLAGAAIYLWQGVVRRGSSSGGPPAAAQQSVQPSWRSPLSSIRHGPLTRGAVTRNCTHVRPALSHHDIHRGHARISGRALSAQPVDRPRPVVPGRCPGRVSSGCAPRLRARCSGDGRRCAAHAIKGRSCARGRFGGCRSCRTLSPGVPSC